MSERKGTTPLTAREEPEIDQKTCMGCDQKTARKPLPLGMG